MSTYLDTIETYYHGCNTADEALMVSTFCSDIVHYFVDHKPIHGAETLAHCWAVAGPRTRATWQVDHFIEESDEAVIEWAMRWTPPGTSDAEVLRGTEWFRFREGKIAEIRSYHNNHRLQHPDNAALHGFPYAERGYSPRC